MDGLFSMKGPVSLPLDNPVLPFLVCVLNHSVLSDSCDPMDRSLPGTSVHGILQARILEWVAISFSLLSLPDQRLNLGLRQCRQILYCLSHQASLAATPVCIRQNIPYESLVHGLTKMSRIVFCEVNSNATEKIICVKTVPLGVKCSRND